MVKSELGFLRIFRVKFHSAPRKHDKFLEKYAEIISKEVKEQSAAISFKTDAQLEARTFNVEAKQLTSSGQSFTEFSTYDFAKEDGEADTMDSSFRYNLRALPKYKLNPNQLHLNANLLRESTGKLGAILPRSRTPYSAGNYRIISKHIKRARVMGLLPFLRHS